MTVADSLRALAGIKAARGVLEDFERQHRDFLADEAKAERERTGTEPKWSIKNVGSAGFTQPSYKATVTNPDALAKWLTSTPGCDDACWQVESVDCSALALDASRRQLSDELLSLLAEHGYLRETWEFDPAFLSDLEEFPRTADGEPIADTGEVVPGVRLSARSHASLVVRPDAKAVQAMKAQLVANLSPLALPEGEVA